MGIETADQAASAAGAAGSALSALGSKAALGLLGAAALFVLMPPGRPNDAHTTRKELGREIGARMFMAGISSHFGGDWVIDVVNNLAPWTMAAKHPAPFLMLTGALGWYVGRAAALWLYKRQDKDLGELKDELKKEVS